MTEFKLDDIKFTDQPKDLDPEPKKQAPRTSSANNNNRGRGRPTKATAINEMKEEIDGFLMLTAMPLKFRDIHEDGSSCADMIVQMDDKGRIGLTPMADQWARAFATVAVDNKYIKRFFEMGEKGGAWVQVLFATQPIVVGIISNHAGRRRVTDDFGQSPLG